MPLLAIRKDHDRSPGGLVPMSERGARGSEQREACRRLSGVKGWSLLEANILIPAYGEVWSGARKSKNQLNRRSFYDSNEDSSAGNI